MVYIYRKKIGGKDYFYLRASVKKGDKMITKDISYLGNNPEIIQDKLKSIPSRYQKDIRKAYKTLNRFIEVNNYLEKAKQLKLKKNDYLDKSSMEEVEACKIHWQINFSKLDETTKNEILKRFVIDFSFNTTSIEGNTITLKEAENLLLENLTPKNKSLREIYDVINTESVFSGLIKDLNKELNHELMSEIHDVLLENIDARKGYRTTDVRVFRSNFDATPAPYVNADVELLLKWYKENEDKLHPLVLSTLFHHKFEKIHPFMDGNGRTGRMLMNYILLKKNYPPTIIRKKNRIKYLAELNKADKCELTKSTEFHYKGLVEFNAKEMSETYWDVFL